MLPLEEARKVGRACSDLYPPTNPVVLGRAIATLAMSHEPGDRDLMRAAARWLASLVEAG